jgi:hypothetical protein
MQAIEGPGLQEAGDGEATSLDEYPTMPQSPQRLQKSPWIETVGAIRWQPYNVALGRRRKLAEGTTGRTGHYEGSSGTIGEDMLVRIQAIIRIENDPDRVDSLDLPHGEMRIIRFDGASSHNHSVHEGSEAMEPADVGWTCDIVGVPACRCNAAIEALPRLGNDQVSLELEW